MTIAMPDSIVPANMPPKYKAYLAYVDGARSKDADQVRVMFAGAEILTLTVLGGGAKADGCDMEPGDLSPEGAAEWLHLAIIAGQSRPVLYASRDAVPGVLDLLGDAHVSRSQVRILSAHYGAGQHICSPAACGASFAADGTQWTDSFATGGPNSKVIDMSLLAGDFFTPAGLAPAWVFAPVRGLSARPGHTSVSLAWTAPAGTEPEPVDHYQVTIRKDGQDIPTYPRDVPRAAGVQVWQGGSLPPGTVLEAFVRAVTADVNGHASPWATVTFTTGHD